MLSEEFSDNSPTVLDVSSLSADDTVLSAELSAGGASLCSLQPVRIETQTAAHKMTVESLFIFIKIVPS